MPAGSTDRSSPRRMPAHLRRMWPAFSVLVLGLATTLVIQSNLRLDARAEDAARFNAETRRTRNTLAARVNHYLVAVQHLQGLFHAAGEVDADQWRRWLPSMNWPWQYPNLLEIGYAEMDSSDGAPTFRVVHSAGPKGPGSFYPVGSDIGDSPGNREAMEISRRTGQTVSGGVQRFAPPAGETVGAHLVFYPVYHGGVEPPGAARPDQIRGYTYGLFQADDLYRGTVGAETNALVGLQVRDVTDLGSAALAHPTNSTGITERHGNVFVRQDLEAALGRTWSLRFTSLPSFAVGSRSHLAPISLAVGSALSLTFFAIAWVQVRGRIRAESLTGEIRGLNADLERRVALRTRELETTQEDLAKALAGERELGELKDRFVAMVSHEFRTPLGIIMSAVELLRSYFDRLDPEKRGVLLDDIHASTRQMAALMEQVLLLGRVSAGQQTLARVPLDLPLVVSRITGEVGAATGQASRIQLALAGEGFEGARSDESVLRHILSNLLSNACKYSPEEKSVDLAVRRLDRAVEFVVTDHGIGVPEADQKRLFEAFQRASNVGAVEGTGLGLLIVKRCVDLHGGTIRFQSGAGRGTTVTVALPMFEAEAGAAGQAPPGPPVSPPRVSANRSA